MRNTLALVISTLAAAALPALAETWNYQGVNIYYSVQGTGPSVVQVHGIGAGASSEQVKYQISDLVNAGYRVYSLDLAGFGKSINGAQLFTGNFHGAAVTAFVNEVAQGPTALIGHSLGGTYAIAAAIALPGKVTNLVLGAPVGSTRFTKESDAESAARWQDLVTSNSGKLFYNVLGSWPNLKNFCGRDLYVDDSFCTNDTVQDYYQYTRIPESIYGAGAFLTGNTGLDIRAGFAALRIPILMIWGDQNRLTPIDEGVAFQQLNPAARLIVLPAASAMANDEKKVDFNSLTLTELANALRKR